SETTGKFIRKKRFGKSLANKAPSLFLTILKRKLGARGGLYFEVDTYDVKASQYNHLNEEYKTKNTIRRSSLKDGISLSIKKTKSKFKEIFIQVI
ncbi:MAG TPA: transposase, partial [Clostridiaceae bacterium]